MEPIFREPREFEGGPWDGQIRLMAVDGSDERMRVFDQTVYFKGNRTLGRYYMSDRRGLQGGRVFVWFPFQGGEDEDTG